jgi:hypothetical protein
MLLRGHRGIGRVRIGVSSGGGTPDPPSGDWTAPIGIPAPEFGITQTAPDWPADWSSPVAGFYWVEPTAAGATNTVQSGELTDANGARFGSSAKPRTTIPNALPAGAVVKVVGAYATTHYNIVCSGTAESPVYIRGTSALVRPTVTSVIYLGGSYFIAEHLNCDYTATANGKLWIGGSSGNPATYCAVRHCTVTGDGATSTGIHINNSNDTNAQSHIVIYDNTVSESGDWTGENGDHHLLSVPYTGTYRTVSDVWIVDNTLFRSDGNGLQIGGGSNGSGSNARIQRIYVGRNTVYETLQEGLWTKQATDVIFSENTVHDTRQNYLGTQSNGGGLGCQYGPDYVWFIFNTVYSCKVGIMFGGSGDTPGQHNYIIGNLFYDIHDVYSQTTWTDDYGTKGYCGVLWGDEVWVLHNTCVDVDGGFISPNTDNKHLVGNIVSGRNTGVAGHDVFFSTLTAGSAFDYNDFEGVSVRLGTTTYSTLAALKAALASDRGQNCLASAPAFTDATGHDYTLQAASPCVNAGGPLPQAYADFETRYGVSIAKDRSGAVRPATDTDMGCYER